MRTTAFVLSYALVAVTSAHAGDEPAENPVAVQFREHMRAADQNKDGFVTREELVAEIVRDTSRDPETAEQIAAAMIRDLDTDHDGKLSAAEINAGARKAGEHASIKQNVSRAQQIMEAIAVYKDKNAGARPAKLTELAELHLVPEVALHCILADGGEKPWGYEAGDKRTDDPNAVVLFSPGRVDSDGQYIVGLGGGKVLGLHDSELELEKVPRLKMHVYPDK